MINYQGHSLEIVNELLENDVWKIFLDEKEINLKAFPYDYSSWDQPDTRWILGKAWIANILYPEKIPESDVIGLVIDFYSYFYTVEETIISNEILPGISTFF